MRGLYVSHESRGACMRGLYVQAGRATERLLFLSISGLQKHAIQAHWLIYKPIGDSLVIDQKVNRIAFLFGDTVK